MRISEQWLREWVDPACDTGALAHALTMAGLEVDAVEPAAPSLDGVVCARIGHVEPMAGSDHLTVCSVDAGDAQPIQVVCGAPNVAAGLTVPLARPGTTLPDGPTVEATEVRGVHSQGMLCSAQELGLSDDASGLLVLDGADAPAPGTPIATALGLPDTVLEIDLTPNRADCLGMLGVAREVGACTGTPFTEPEIAPITPTLDERHPVHLEAGAACPRYAGRVLRGVDPTAPSPLWLRERLRRAGIRSVSALVDITNYVLIEYGQPLHAFDLDRLSGPIRVRWSQGNEDITLLSGDALTLDGDTLVIADDTGPVALAGVMGGQDSAVDDTTRTVFLESAHFAPHAISGRARRYGLHTDASHRFERGVDPELPARAAERATELILSICGGECGPMDVAETSDGSSAALTVTLRRDRLARLLGWSIPEENVTAHLRRLGLAPETDENTGAWTTTVPSWRFDLAREEDLIEEIARLEGYDRAPERRLEAPMLLSPAPEGSVGADSVRRTLVERGYFEAITYSFVDPALQQALDPDAPALELANPLSAELAVMRTSLWPGLIQAVRHNQHRQQPRVRLFEVGRAFLGGTPDALEQPWRVAGVATGRRLPEHWDKQAAGTVDFYDVKADVEALLRLAGLGGRIDFRAAEHPALHPGQAARLLDGERPSGWLGRLHPACAEALELDDPVFLFEFDLALLDAAPLPAYTPLSRFPSVRRDLAVVVPEEVAATALEAAARDAVGPTLREVTVFDVYRGKGIPEGHKSVALGLIVQDDSRTLTDGDVETLVSRAVRRLEEIHGATLRGE